MAEIDTQPKYYDYGIPQTKQFEGFRDKTYLDTLGNPTIGYGFNLNDKNMRSLVPADVISGQRPLSQKEADSIFLVRYNQAAKDAFTYLGDDMLKLDPERQAIIVDMAYNMGPNKLAEFKQLKKAISEGDYNKAASEMKNSSWYKQTGNRAKHHVLKFSEQK
jgi:GH24 family phage-related lysozyme (muramidase)